MEVWVKFRAESIDLPTALDVGRHVFGALNIVERVFFVFLLIVVFYRYTNMLIVGTGILIFTFIVAQSGYIVARVKRECSIDNSRYAASEKLGSYDLRGDGNLKSKRFVYFSFKAD